MLLKLVFIVAFRYIRFKYIVRSSMFYPGYIEPPMTERAPDVGVHPHSSLLSVCMTEVSRIIKGENNAFEVS